MPLSRNREDKTDMPGEESRNPSSRLLNYFPPGENYSWAISILAEILASSVSSLRSHPYLYSPPLFLISLTNVVSYVTSLYRIYSLKDVPFALWLYSCENLFFDTRSFLLLSQRPPVWRSCLVQYLNAPEPSRVHRFAHNAMCAQRVLFPASDVVGVDDEPPGRFWFVSDHFRSRTTWCLSRFTSLRSICDISHRLYSPIDLSYLSDPWSVCTLSPSVGQCPKHVWDTHTRRFRSSLLG